VSFSLATHPTTQQVQFTKAQKLHMLDRLAWSDMFETFLANKYTAAKRFGLEGAESLIPGMKTIIDTAADMGMQSVVIGMPHRGGGLGLCLSVAESEKWAGTVRSEVGWMGVQKGRVSAP
jgi:hypothetical protein